MADGSVFEYDAPAVGSYDTTKTYLIEMKLNVRKYKFKSIKSRLRVRKLLESQDNCFILIFFNESTKKSLNVNVKRKKSVKRS